MFQLWNLPRHSVWQITQLNHSVSLFLVLRYYFVLSLTILFGNNSNSIVRQFRVNCSKMICSHQHVSHGNQRCQHMIGSIVAIKKSRKSLCSRKAWNAVSICKNNYWKLIFFSEKLIKSLSWIRLTVSSTLPVTQPPPLTPNKTKTEQHSPPSNILQSYNRQINTDNDKYKQEEVRQ